MSEPKVRYGAAGWPLLFLAIVACLSVGWKIELADVGAPYVTIDDCTAYEGGFCVWFGNAPPQRMYLESWIIGASSILYYAAHALAQHGLSALDGNLVSAAYRDFLRTPDGYVHAYRLLIVAIDLITALIVYLMARGILGGRWRGWGAALVGAAYLLSYNTVWCNVVARPDTVTSLFSALGLLFYFRSRAGEDRRDLMLAAASFGLATGMKLHAMFFVVFAALDMARVHGVRATVGRISTFCIVALLMFAVAAGSPLFDPLKYVKLRLLNARDDESPWIRWGEQVWVVLRGTGWLAVPMLVAGVAGAMRSGRRALREPAYSVVFLAMCWLLLFLSIRQLRAYWMLPALPLLYVAAMQWLTSLAHRRLAGAAAGMFIVLLAGQFAGQAREFMTTPFGELRSWIVENVDPTEPFYVFGYEAIELPKNADCLGRTAAGLTRGIEADKAAAMPFYERHIAQWEERTRLMLIDLIDDPGMDGYDYYSHYRAPLDEYEGILSLEEMQVLFVQEHFVTSEIDGLDAYLAERCVKVAELTGPGGGGRGLAYQVYTPRDRGRTAP